MSVLSRARWASTTILVLAAATLPVGVPPASAADVSTTFDRPHAITFNDGPFGVAGGAITVPASGTATPYPSQIVVDEPGLVLDLDVTVEFVHDRPDDLDVLLVGPHGQSVVLMSDAGGIVPTDAEPTFDDEADGALPDDDPIEFLNGSYRPSDFGDGPDAFPAPAPSPSASGPALGAFDGTTAAGTWSLYVVDDNGTGAGQITGWELTLALAAPGTYPSELQVSGIGSVTDVDVSIRGFDTEFGRDMTFLLVGPRGQAVVLMNDVGGGSSEAVTGVDLRFDDEAPYGVPEFDALESRSYQPTNAENPPAEYPPPAPEMPLEPGPPTSLGVFDGTDPNGTWRLFGFDDSRGQVSAMDGWSLHLRWSDAAGPGGTVAVDDGAARTRTRAVELDLSATDAAPGTGVTSMRLSNDGASYGPWVPYAATTSWQLGTSDGSKAVFVQFRDGAGNVSETARDTIVLDTKAPRAKKSLPADAARQVAPGARLKVWATNASRPRPSMPRR